MRFFFFSSRRRHTRFSRDWSSDVCSSDLDDVMEAVVEAGAEEVNDLGESFEVISEATDLVAVRTALQQAGIDYESAETQFLPSVTVELDAEGAGKVFRLIEALEDSDDVQDVFANFDVFDEVMAEVG